jgi:acetyl esterase/lipase
MNEVTVTQLPAIRPIVTSVFAFYPPCDFTVTHHQKSRLRRYKAGVGGFRARETDYMLSMSPMIDWSYIPHGTDMRNPLLSQFFAEHDMLPRRVMIVGCELDMYAHEAWRTISKLAGREVPAMEQTVGREGQSDHGQMLFDDERFHFEQTYNDGSSYKWLLVPDTSKWCYYPGYLGPFLNRNF